ncbi:NAD(P)-binding domain-containing protein [Aquisediminimonas profunda]|uniref:NAD(P)-binding domain-containing protein n=1 Tax=Aquisediminimonas profunda TaxID=1550733 RepID=UPI001C62EF3F|nr:NAD(P)-binding domain-containing protein [Aquisediminimonas profunda]
MHFNPLLLAYAVPLVGLWLTFYIVSRRRTKRALAVMEEARIAGLTEPASLHPVIDPALCLGCAACVKACPEKSILGIIDGKAKLIEPSHCVGHGACATSCPTDAISLVFGTETRGVDIPHVSPKFETNVPGLFIAGELGGMGLIRNAIEQGRQAIRHIAAKARAIEAGPEVLDLLIVGAGPAGISAALGATEQKLKFRIVEQDTLGGTVAHFPRGKLVMTAPAELPLVGKVKFGEISKEKLLEFWEGVVAQTGLRIDFEERVDSVSRENGLFIISTNRSEFRAKTVLLAIGRRGTPRTLGVPGEDSTKVVYRLVDPQQYGGQHVLVVGGGDSALEAAASISDEAGTHVTLAYRGKAFDRARQKNRDRVNAAASAGRISVLLESDVERIAMRTVAIRTPQGVLEIANDAVIVCAGGVLPTEFLKRTGIEVETKFGTV